MKKKRRDGEANHFGATEIDRLLDVTQTMIIRLQNSIDEATAVAQALEVMKAEVSE